jgi:hypothetical protein
LLKYANRKTLSPFCEFRGENCAQTVQKVKEWFPDLAVDRIFELPSGLSRVHPLVFSEKIPDKDGYGVETRGGNIGLP